MGTTAINELRAAALSLGEADRAELATELVASLDGAPDTEAEALWDAEISRRITQVQSGSSTLLEPTEVIEAARNRLQGS